MIKLTTMFTLILEGLKYLTVVMSQEWFNLPMATSQNGR